VDKATKLQTIYDRIEVVKTRLEVLKRDAEIARLKGESGVDGDLGRYAEMADFLAQVNAGGEFLADEKIEKIREIGQLEFELNGERRPLLTAEEIENLSIRRGTLTGAERGIINNHVALTIKMLEKLPFPRKLRRVPEFAGMHHEKLDGSGYPRGICAEKIPLQARILAVADVFEALTAADRPYSHGKKLSEAMRIIGFMVKDKHLDEDLCELLVRSGLVQVYSRDKISERQRDFLEWRGEKLELNS